MDIFNNDKLVLFFLFFIPGFISMKVYTQFVASDKIDFSKSILEAIAFSCFNYAFFSWLIFLIITEDLQSNHPFWFVFLVFLLIFIFPIGWAILAFYLPKNKWLSRFILDPNKSAWDYVFSQRKAYWAIVHLKDGRKIGGKFGAQSYASSHPRKPEIFIEEIWEIDQESGKFVKRLDRPAGILILNEEILAVELIP